MKQYPAKTCICGTRLWSFKSKLRHQRTCWPATEQRLRDAAAEAMDPPQWERKL